MVFTAVHEELRLVEPLLAVVQFNDRDLSGNSEFFNLHRFDDDRRCSPRSSTKHLGAIGN